MKKTNYELIIFDLDGTIADTSEGIYYCHILTSRYMKRKEPALEDLKGVIGGSLLKTYIEKFGYDEQDARIALRYFRDKNEEIGIYKSTVYDGIKEILSFIKNAGIKTDVASLKSEAPSKKLIKEKGLSEYFDVIHGVDENDTLSKVDLINLCINDLKVEKSKTLLIGDSISDSNGAQKVGIDFIAVTYGFGFKSKEDLKNIPNIGVFESVGEMKDWFERLQT